MAMLKTRHLTESFGVATADPIELVVSSDFNLGFGFEKDLKISDRSLLKPAGLFAVLFSTLLDCSDFAFTFLSY